eukprot:1160798-Pelagomonas_calceolata.AAC.3
MKQKKKARQADQLGSSRKALRPAHFSAFAEESMQASESCNASNIDDQSNSALAISDILLQTSCLLRFCFCPTRCPLSLDACCSSDCRLALVFPLPACLLLA